MNNSQATVPQLQATTKVYTLRSEMQNDNELAKLLNLSKVTTYTRLKRHNWTNPEILYIEYLTNSKVKTLVDSLNVLNS